VRQIERPDLYMLELYQRVLVDADPAVRVACLSGASVTG
jgi:hypothetical protein